MKNLTSPSTRTEFRCRSIQSVKGNVRGNIVKKGITEKEKLEYAKDLGVSLNELYSSNGMLSEPELNRRIIEAERAQREGRFWIIAVISAIASVVSAIAAWMAVMKN